jgi:hypothetical protein
MIKMAQIEPNREWLLRYVLGELSEDETRSADERFFSDEIFAAMLDETYRDVLDAYAAGEIAGSEEARVGRAFFAESHQERQLKILQAMRAMPANVGRLTKRAVEPVSKRWFLSFWPIAVSVGVLSLAVAAVVYQYSVRFRGASNRSAAVGEPVSRNLPEGNSGPTAVAGPVENMYTILLLPNVSRGDEEVKDFAIPPSANEIVFQAVIPQGVTGATFEARLKGARQHDARVFSGLVAQTLETQRYVEFRVQASELPTDAYAVDVFDSGGPPARAVDHFVIRVSHAATPQN